MGKGGCATGNGEMAEDRVGRRAGDERKMAPGTMHDTSASRTPSLDIKLRAGSSASVHAMRTFR